MGDKIVLSYGDCLLRTRDVELLDSPNWLNDSLIGFAFEYLFDQLTDDLKDSVTLISPEVTHFIKLSSSSDGESLPLEIFLEPLDLGKKQFVLMAINDQTDSDAPGGSHWSLLVYSRSADTFVHFDSASSNHRDASRVANRVYPFLGSQNSSLSSSSVPHVIESQHAVKQSNGYDCGMFLISHAQCLVDALLKNDAVDVLTTDFSQLKQKHMNEKRQEWKDRIFMLARG